MTQQPDSQTSIQITSVEQWQAPEGQPGRGMMLKTTRGDIEAIIQHKGETEKAVIWVCGARGGFGGPGDSVYARIADELMDDVTSLRLNYRHPNVLHECVLDALSGVSFLTGTGHTDILLVGHSFGGAVVITAAPFSEHVKGVAALSSQTFGAFDVAKVSPRPLLLVHGSDDTRLPMQCSQQIYEWASEPKELVIYEGAEHGLRECKDELHDLLKRWIQVELGFDLTND